MSGIELWTILISVISGFSLVGIIFIFVLQSDIERTITRLEMNNAFTQEKLDTIMEALIKETDNAQ